MKCCQHDRRWGCCVEHDVQARRELGLPDDATEVQMIMALLRDPRNFGIYRDEYVRFVEDA